MGKHLVIVGAGTGGLMVANAVGRSLEQGMERGEVSVTVLGDRDEYVYQPGFLYLAFDLMRPNELARKVRDLLRPGIRFVHDRAARVDADRKEVHTQGGQVLSYDYLVLATGSDIHPSEVPGLQEGGHWFYTLAGAVRLRDTLRQFTGGRVVLTVGVPHKCPVAPLEFILMFDDWARARGIRGDCEITYTYPIGRAHTIPAVAEWAQAQLEARGIRVETFFNMTEVDPDAKSVGSLEGTTLSYDLLVAIPPHVGDRLGADSGLAEAGNWLPTDRHNLNLVGRDDVFVLGDATNLPVSKAGSVAHFEAEVLAQNLVGLLADGAPLKHRYSGKVFCFIEAGMEKATFITFDYDHPPLVSPPTQSVHWFKQTYNRIHWLNLKGIL